VRARINNQGTLTLADAGLTLADANRGGFNAWHLVGER